ncbi:hypothetical protein JCM10207_004244 [Rhodosporidiobolus poonsookiae]
MFRPAAQTKGGGFRPTPAESYMARTDLRDGPGGYRDLNPSASSSTSRGVAISVPSPNGKSNWDRHYPGGEPSRYRNDNYRGGGGGGGGGHYGRGGPQNAFGVQRQHNAAWNDSASLGGGGNNYGRGGEGFDTRRAPPRPAPAPAPKLEALPWDDPPEPEPGFSTVALSSFHSGPGLAGRESPRAQKQRQEADARKKEAEAARNDRDATARTIADSKRAAQDELVRRKLAAAKVPPAGRSTAPKPVDLFNALSKKTSAKSSAQSTSRNSSTGTDNRDKSKDKGKGKEKPPYLEIDASDDDKSDSKKRKRSRSSDSGSGQLSKLRKGVDGFDDSSARMDENGSAGSPSGSPSKKRKRKEPPPTPPRALAELWKDQLEEDGDASPQKVKLKRKGKAVVVVDSEDDGASGSGEESVDSDDDELLRPVETVDPTTLCPFCDALMPEKPSDELLALQKYLVARPHAKHIPTPLNPLAVRLPFTEVASHCKRHLEETTVIPEGIAQGWPQTIPWDELPKRIERECSSFLGSIITGAASSTFLDNAREEWASKGRKAGNVSTEWGSFAVEMPGYYGQRGFDCILATVKKLFIDDIPLLTADRASPLPVDSFLRRVLVPETAVTLIQSDLALPSRAEAARVCRDSAGYGKAVFPVVDAEERAEFARERDRELKAERAARERREKGEREGEGASQESRSKAGVVDVDADADEDDGDEAAPSTSAAPKPAGRKPKAVREAEAQQQRAAEKTAGKGEKPRQRERERESKGAAGSVASSTTSKSSGVSKSTALTIPDESDSDVEITASAAAGLSKPLKPSKPSKARPPSSSSARAALAPTSSMASVAPTLAQLAAEKENREVELSDSAAASDSSADEILDAEVVETGFKKRAKGKGKKGGKKSKEEKGKGKKKAGKKRKVASLSDDSD